jgi:SAM-dependent methyltransferase
LFRGIPNTRTKIALDFGCGPGRCIIKFNHVFKRIDGVDISPTILEKARHDLNEAKIEIPNLYVTNGKDLRDVPSDTYDVVYSIICMQHISCRDWRLSLYEEFRRVLKPNGYLTFQMGYGPGHPYSRDYFHNYDATDDMHRDVRVEDEAHLIADLNGRGFKVIDTEITEPTHDQHPQWIWALCQRE